MLHIATVHFHSDRWLAPQLEYLERNIRQPYRVWATLEGIDPEPWASRVREVDPRGWRTHALKLNGLAEAIAAEAEPGDTLLFLDGDAFPIAPLDAYLEETLARVPLAAIRRDENAGDVQPHPSFCATTVGFWTEIGGDWVGGPRWRNAVGAMVTDVGGRLLAALDEREIEWQPLLRTNRRDIRSPWFGVYEDLVYHHGAGFRKPLSRAGISEAGPVLRFVLRSFSHLPIRLATPLWRTVARKTFIRRLHPSIEETERISEDVFERLRTDPEFWLEV